jgi:hypothetical protein
MPKDQIQPPAIVRPALDQLQQRIVQHAIEQDRIGSEAHWAAADDYAELVESGLTGQQIAVAVGKSEAHVSQCRKLVAIYPGKSERPDWTTAYAEAKQPKAAGLTAEEINAMTAESDRKWEGLPDKVVVEDDHRVIVSSYTEVDRDDLLDKFGIALDGELVLPDGRRLVARVDVPRTVKVDVKVIVGPDDG